MRMLDTPLWTGHPEISQQDPYAASSDQVNDPRPEEGDSGPPARTKLNDKLL